MIASYFWVGSLVYNSWMLNKLGFSIMDIGSTPPVFWLVFDQLPLHKIWGGTSFFVFLNPCAVKARNYEIDSIYLELSSTAIYISIRNSKHSDVDGEK